MKKIFQYNLITLMGLAAVMSACTAGKDDTGTEYAPNMYHAVPYEPLKQIKDQSSGDWVSSLDNGVGEYYSSNPNNPNEMNMRVPPANTVRRSKYLPYRVPKDSLEMAARIIKNPLDSSKAVLSEGKVLYQKFCSHCHGENGQEPGKVGEIYGGVPSYKSASIVDKPGGHIFHVITHGKGRMGAHASQLSIEERWKIVRHVQVLQQK